MGIHHQIKILHGAGAVAEYLDLPLAAEYREVDAVYPVMANSYYLDLIDRERIPDDPIWRQCMPDMAELADYSSSTDPQEEARHSPVPRLVHRYPDRAVLLVNNLCGIHCRFCFRKRNWGNCDNISDAELAAVRDYLRAHPEVREVLVSGGDPLMLPLERLEKVLETLSELEVIRVASRLPAVMPMAVTDEHVRLLSKPAGLWLMTHFNHPREVTPEAEACCRRFILAGIPVLNQTVLLRGVNDTPQIMEELFRRLIRIKVKPHYMFHVDPVKGVRHFAAGIDCGLGILRYFRSNLSSLAVPAFAIDLPEGGGKVNLQPDYTRDGLYQSVDGAKWIAYEEKYKNE